MKQRWAVFLMQEFLGAYDAPTAHDAVDQYRNERGGMPAVFRFNYHVFPVHKDFTGKNALRNPGQEYRRLAISKDCTYVQS